MIHIDVRSAFRHSDSLQAHIERRIGAALRTHAPRVRRVSLRLFDANGPRGGGADKVARLAIALAPAGRIVATGSAADVYVSVNRAAARARQAVDRYVERQKLAARSAAGT